MGNIVYNEDELKALGMGDYVFNAGRAVDSYLQQGMLSGNRLDSDPVSAGISRNLGDNHHRLNRPRIHHLFCQGLHPTDQGYTR